MATTAERLRMALDMNKMKQSDLVKKAGINKGALSSYLSGKYIPKQNSIYAMAKALNVSEGWLMGFDVPMERKEIYLSSKGVQVKVVGRVAAGIPFLADEDVIGYEEVSDEVAKSGQIFGLLIRGNSMEPRICDRDVVIVRKQDYADDGDIVIALIDGEDATCKRLKMYKDGLALVSSNPAFQPMYFTAEEVANKPVQIVGKVIELRGKFEHE